MDSNLLIKQFRFNGINEYIIRDITIASDNFTTEVTLNLDDEERGEILNLLISENVECLVIDESIRVRATFSDISNVVKALTTLKKCDYINADFLNEIFQNYPIGRRNLNSNLPAFFGCEYEPITNNISRSNNSYGFFNESKYKRPNLNNVPSEDEISTIYGLNIVSFKKNDDESITIEFKNEVDYQIEQIEKVQKILDINNYIILNKNTSGNVSIQIYSRDVDKFSQKINQMYYGSSKPLR